MSFQENEAAKKILAIFMVLASLFILAGLTFLSRDFYRQTFYDSVTATVTDNFAAVNFENRTASNVWSELTFEHNGERRVTRRNQWFRLGREVPLLINPGNPEQIIIITPNFGIIRAIPSLVTGTILFGIGAFMYLLTKRKLEPWELSWDTFTNYMQNLPTNYLHDSNVSPKNKLQGERRMKFKRMTPAWAYGFFIILYIMFAFLVSLGITERNTEHIVIGLLGLAGATVFVVLMARSAVYILEREYLHIKGNNYGVKTDKKIRYKDIISIGTFKYNKASWTSIMFWVSDKTEKINFPSPNAYKEKIFLARIDAERKKSDLSHIISPEYIEAYGNIELELEKCEFMDYCRLKSDMHIALLQDSERVILLSNCSIYKKEVIISTTPPELGEKQYIWCSIEHIQHTEYKNIKEALADTSWNETLKKEVRKIDSLAYNQWCDLYK